MAQKVYQRRYQLKREQDHMLIDMGVDNKVYSSEDKLIQAYPELNWVFVDDEWMSRQVVDNGLYKVVRHTYIRELTVSE